MDERVELVSLACTAGWAFGSDPPRLRVPFRREPVQELGTKCQFAKLGYGEDGHSWKGDRGVVEIEGEIVDLVSVEGTPLSLSVSVMGDTALAEKAVNAFWAVLGEVAEERSQSQLPPHSVTYSTLAVVRSPTLLSSRFPGFSLLKKHLLSGLEDSSSAPPRVRGPHLEYAVERTVRGSSELVSIMIEPRFTSLQEEAVWFTVSPLRSDLHMQLLGELAEVV